MKWCEWSGIYYLFGMARNPRLIQRITKPLAKSTRRCQRGGQLALRFVVTDLPHTMTDSIQSIYKQQQRLFSSRTCTSWIHANQLRLEFSLFVYALLHAFRRLALCSNRLEKTQCLTLQVRFLKIATGIQIINRRM